MKKSGYYIRSSITADDIFDMDDIRIRKNIGDKAWIKDEYNNYGKVWFNQYGQVSFLEEWPGTNVNYFLDVFVRDYHSKFLADYEFYELAEEHLMKNPTDSSNTIELVNEAFKYSTTRYHSYIQQNYKVYHLTFNKNIPDDEKAEFYKAVIAEGNFPFEEDIRNI